MSDTFAAPKQKLALLPGDRWVAAQGGKAPALEHPGVNELLKESKMISINGKTLADATAELNRFNTVQLALQGETLRS